MDGTTPQNRRAPVAETALIPGEFVHGRDSLTQRQAIAWAKAFSWSRRNLEGGAVEVIKGGHQLTLAAGTYSPARAEEIVRTILEIPDIVPPGRGAPTSPEFTSLLEWWKRQGHPMIGVGAFGPQMPRVRDPSDSAPTSEELSGLMRRYMRQRCYWAQPGYPTTWTLDNRARREMLRDGWTATTSRSSEAKSFRPRQNLAVCMWGSVQRHIRRKDDSDLADFLEVQKRKKGLDQIVDKGSETWALLGAWPWACFPEGHLPEAWEEIDACWVELAAAGLRYAADLADQAAALLDRAERTRRLLDKEGSHES